MYILSGIQKLWLQRLMSTANIKDFNGGNFNMTNIKWFPIFQTMEKAQSL